MLRRLVTAGFAAALAAPIFATAPANAAVLFSCTSFSGSATLTPGLQNTAQAQTDLDASGSISGCSNSQSGTVVTGQPAVTNATTTYPPRPLSCPVALGGAGPEYPDQTPIFLSADPGFSITWGTGPGSTGITKVKQGPGTGQVRALLVITAGQYAPPAGMKTKAKSTVQFAPVGTAEVDWSCTTNGNPLDQVTFASGSLIVQQV
jgi:hypothetical protein